MFLQYFCNIWAFNIFAGRSLKKIINWLRLYLAIAYLCMFPNNYKTYTDKVDLFQIAMENSQ